MKIKHSSIVTASSGRLGGSVSQRQKTGQVLRAQSATKRRKRQPPEGLRHQVADPFPIIKKLEKKFQSLTRSQRQAWIQFAQNHPRPNALGDPVIITGAQMFAKCNYTEKIVYGTFQNYPRVPGPSNDISKLYYTAPLAGAPITIHVESYQNYGPDLSQFRYFWPRHRGKNNCSHLPRVTLFAPTILPGLQNFIPSVGNLGFPLLFAAIYRFQVRLAPKGNQPGKWHTVDVEFPPKP